MDNAQSERREITYTVMRGWRDGEGMHQHRNGGPFTTLAKALRFEESNGGYVRRDSDGAALAPDGSWVGGQDGLGFISLTVAVHSI